MLEAANQFAIAGNVETCERYGNGHINKTYLVRTDRNRRYILQNINQNVFRDVPALMQNIASVTEYLRRWEPDPRRVLHLVPTMEAQPYFLDADGEYWRMYDFVEDSLCLEKVTTPDEFYQSAIAFGTFQRDLANFPAATLTETIPRFHDTPNRYRALHEAIEKDVFHRRGLVENEIAFALAREGEAGALQRMRMNGELPTRVTHNDTKLNNVLLDSITRKPLCVIDLDTVMPGLACYDFGDSIRFGATTAAEDERDLSRVQLDLALYGVYADGYLDACGQALTDLEIETLPLGAKLMTLECGVRFLADYLSGDQYFQVHRPDHNLDRCRTQFKLVADTEEKWSEINGMIAQKAEKSRPVHH